MIRDLFAQFKHVPRSPNRGLQAIVGPAPFSPTGFTQWAIEQGELHDITPRRVMCLAAEYAEVVECQHRVPSTELGEFDGAGFTQWMSDIGMTRDVSVKQLSDAVAWYCLVVGRCLTPSDSLLETLTPHGWERYRPPQRARGNKMERPTLYRYVQPMRQAA